MNLEILLDCERLKTTRIGNFMGVSTANVWRAGLGRLGKALAFLYKEMVKASDSEDFGVPVVKDKALSVGDFLGRKTFHSGAGKS